MAAGLGRMYTVVLHPILRAWPVPRKKLSGRCTLLIKVSMGQHLELRHPPTHARHRFLRRFDPLQQQPHLVVTTPVFTLHDRRVPQKVLMEKEGNPLPQCGQLRLSGDASEGGHDDVPRTVQQERLEQDAEVHHGLGVHLGVGELHHLKTQKEAFSKKEPPEIKLCQLRLWVHLGVSELHRLQTQRRHSVRKNPEKRKSVSIAAWGPS